MNPTNARCLAYSRCSMQSSFPVSLSLGSAHWTILGMCIPPPSSPGEHWPPALSISSVRGCGILLGSNREHQKKEG